MLNIGGINNITVLFGDLDARKAFATDLGPGNTLLDAFTRKYFEMDFDEDGKIAQEGEINPLLLAELKSHNFFNLSIPKTTGPELFNLHFVEAAQFSSGTINIKPSDVVSTLTRFTAETIADGIISILGDKVKFFHIYGSGGGTHNPILMKHLKEILLSEIKLTDELGIPGDAKEAILFATLANETVAGGRTNFGDRLSIPSVTMGKISLPW